MKRYKKLQHIVNESLAKNRDEQLLKSLKIQNEHLINAKRKSTKRPFKLAMVSSCVAVVLVVAIIGGLFLFKQDSGSTDQYFIDNEIRIESTVSELNTYTDFIDLSSSIDWRVTKGIDGVYNHVLYFIIMGDNYETFETYHFTIVVNKNYKKADMNLYYNQEQSISNQTLIYYEEVEVDDDMIYTFKSRGKIVTEKETVFMNYESVGFNETSNFIPSISNLLIFS